MLKKVIALSLAGTTLVLAACSDTGPNGKPNKPVGTPPPSASNLPPPPAPGRAADPSGMR